MPDISDLLIEPAKFALYTFSKIPRFFDPHYTLFQKYKDFVGNWRNSHESLGRSSRVGPIGCVIYPVLLMGGIYYLNHTEEINNAVYNLFR